MGLLRINLMKVGLVLHGSPAPADLAITQALRGQDGPVTLLVHGFKYWPGSLSRCPHETLFASHAGAGVPSWPARLPQNQSHLTIALGWCARGSIWNAYRNSAQAGERLAELLTLIQTIAPHRPVNIIAHSLGARVALRAVGLAPQASVATLILLAAAEFGSVAKAALSSPAGQSLHLLNVTSRQNDLFDALLEWLVPAPERRDRVIGHAALQLPNVCTLQIDHDASLAALRRAGFDVGAPTRKVSHGSTYSRPGMFALYREVLSGQLSLHGLSALLPETTERRWARFMPHRPRSLPVVPQFQALR